MPPEQEKTHTNRQPTDSIGFMVGTRTVAIYGDNLKQESQNFIKSFNANYWGHQLALAKTEPENEVTQEHSAFLKLTLSHAEEHLFGLICA